MRRFNQFNKSDGFTLVEVLVVAGIMGVMAVGITQMMDNLNKTTRTAGEKNTRLEMRFAISSALKNRIACGRTFAGLGFDDDNDPGTPSIQLEPGAIDMTSGSGTIVNIWGNSSSPDPATGAGIIATSNPESDRNRIGGGGSQMLIDRIWISCVNNAGVPSACIETGGDPLVDPNENPAVVFVRFKKTQTDLECDDAGTSTMDSNRSYGARCITERFPITIFLDQNNAIMSCYSSETGYVEAACAALGGTIVGTECTAISVNYDYSAHGTGTGVGSGPYADNSYAATFNGRVRVREDIWAQGNLDVYEAMTIGFTGGAAYDAVTGTGSGAAGALDPGDLMAYGSITAVGNLNGDGLSIIQSANIGGNLILNGVPIGVDDSKLTVNASIRANGGLSDVIAGRHVIAGSQLQGHSLAIGPGETKVGVIDSYRNILGNDIRAAGNAQVDGSLSVTGTGGGSNGHGFFQGTVYVEEGKYKVATVDYVNSTLFAFLDKAEKRDLIRAMINAAAETGMADIAEYVYSNVRNLYYTYQPSGMISGGPPYDPDGCPPGSMVTDVFFDAADSALGRATLRVYCDDAFTEAEIEDVIYLGLDCLADNTDSGSYRDADDFIKVDSTACPCNPTMSLSVDWNDPDQSVAPNHTDTPQGDYDNPRWQVSCNTYLDNLPSCTEVPIGAYCEGDGECGAEGKPIGDNLIGTSNCGSYDVFVRIR